MRSHIAKHLTKGLGVIFCNRWKYGIHSVIPTLIHRRQIHLCHYCFQKMDHHRHHHQASCHRPPITGTDQHRLGRIQYFSSTSSSYSLFNSYFHKCIDLQATRQYSTFLEGDSSTNILGDPFKLVLSEVSTLSQDICQVLGAQEPLLKFMSHYYFDGKGKTFRPLVTFLMSRACNIHSNLGNSILATQKMIAMVVEMIHNASLMHDDVIDASDTRRGQASLNKMHGQRQSILVGDYILSKASITLARTGNPQVISIISSILEDLVSGEFMQLGSKEDENERFSHYLKKTYKKTASLIANACKAVAVLSQVDEDITEMAFQYGRNLGIAFQLVDDLLDFISNDAVMGKPTAADLKLGLATAPVLFAAQEYPELNPMIMRRFSEQGDVELARSLVAKSDGVEQTKLLALHHSREAVKHLQNFAVSDSQQALIRLATVLLDRKN